MARIRSGTLVPNVQTSVTIDGMTEQITVLNRDGTGTLWFTADGSPAVVAGDGCYPVLGSRVIPAPLFTAATTVNLIADSAISYTVIGESQ